ncbi:MAG: MFS transporter, partial [Eubacterium sp.]
MIGLYYDTFQAATGATDIQLGVIQSAYTTMTIATYFLGGLLADRVSSKTLLSISYLATGVLAVIVGFFPAYTMMVILFGAMGITTTLTFWAALIKATRVFAKAGGEGTALASMEG